MFLLGLSETIDQLAMANSVRWYSYVLSRENGHVLRMALGIEVVVQWKKGGPKSRLKLDETRNEALFHETQKSRTSIPNVF